MSIKATLKQLLPSRVQYFYARLRSQKIQRQYQSLSLTDAFAKIYESGAWGPWASDGMPSSGLGSRPEYVEQWCSLVETELRSRRVGTVADLGCGNFAVGMAVTRFGYAVIGVDIAQPVVDWDRRVYPSERVSFVQADLASDPLPYADAAIVRQVLQHLSNSEVERVLANILRTYPLAFITEHVYAGPGCVPNIDMPHGPGTRVPMRSGIFVDRCPFSIPARILGDIYIAPREVMRTWVVEKHAPVYRAAAQPQRSETHADTSQR
jgi:SAM-dependent methyltransferase